VNVRAPPEPTPGAGAAPRVRLVGVSCGYDRREILTDVDLDVPARGVVAFVGENGSGKTTLLRVLLGLLAPRAGRIEYGPGPDGRPAPPRVGYVPQTDLSEVLFPVTAAEVVLMGLTPGLSLFGRPRARHREQARAALDLLGVGALAQRPFRSLSGGQRQRVLLARGLVADPELLVLDEPVRGLDFGSSTRLMRLIARLARERGLVVVVATHSLDLVATHADSVALFRDGRLRAGPAHEIMTDAVLSEFHGLPMRVHELDGQHMVVPGRAP
jgi:ABC-type Mn2+/Zn2+ transport system ATPase subunit